MSTSHPLRVFAVSTVLTVLISVAVVILDGWADLWVFVVLALLEVTFSFDNAVINSKVLQHLSHFWQTMFLTVGIFVAVFLIRFLLPIGLVAIAGQQSLGSVTAMALNQPADYADLLDQAMPIISAFGGLFLLMVALHFFIDKQKRVEWLKPVEQPLKWLASLRYAAVWLGLLVLGLSVWTVAPGLRLEVAIAGALGILLYSVLHAASNLASQHTPALGEKAGKAALVGRAAAMSFVYLEVLDASFSLDGVVGAFAITSNVVLIMAGLGVGAVWVRSLTVYLLRAGTLVRYRFLEHGAHWAIMALGIIMVLRLLSVESPEWLTGLVGIVFIVASLISSRQLKH